MRVGDWELRLSGPRVGLFQTGTGAGYSWTEVGGSGDKTVNLIYDV